MIRLMVASILCGVAHGRCGDPTISRDDWHTAARAFWICWDIVLEYVDGEP